MDEQGVCVACGLPSEASADTQPNGADAIHVAPMALAEPTIATPTAPRRKGKGKGDPASTNPSTGAFCGRCGSAVDLQSDYCGICGTPLNDAALTRMRQVRLHGAQALSRLVDADAADTLPPLSTPRAISPMRWIAMVFVGIVLIGIALGVLILHLR